MPRPLPPFPPSLPWDARELVRLTTPALEAKRERDAAIRRAAREAIAAEAEVANVSAPAHFDAPAAIEFSPDPEPAMPYRQPAHPALIEAGATAAERGHARTALRRVCALLGLPQFCPRAACGRTGRCKGNPERCIPALTPKVPAPARAWVRTLLQAEENGVDPDEMTDQAAEWEAAHAAWLAGLTAKRQ